MSHVEGADALIGKLNTFTKSVGDLCYEFHDQEMRATQDEAVSLIPVDSGKSSAALASEEALQRRTDPETGETQWEFGMVTLAIQRAAYHLFFVEFGTKSYMKGEMRKAGRKKLAGARWRFVSTKTARDTARFEYRESIGAGGQERLEAKLTDPQRWQRMKRMVPPRPAQPWLRPARANLYRRIRDLQNLDRLVRSAMRAAKLSGGD
jgi:hypothetical protein